MNKNLKTKGTLMLVVLVMGIVMGCVGQQTSQQTTPTIQQTTPAIQQNPLATVIGKTFVIKNIKTNSGVLSQDQNMEYNFGATLIIISLNGKQSSHSVKISEFRLSDGLYVNLTDFGEADYPYWQKMTFYGTDKRIEESKRPSPF